MANPVCEEGVRTLVIVVEPELEVFEIALVTVVTLVEEDPVRQMRSFAYVMEEQISDS